MQIALLDESVYMLSPTILHKIGNKLSSKCCFKHEFTILCTSRINAALWMALSKIKPVKINTKLINRVLHMMIWIIYWLYENNTICFVSNRIHSVKFLIIVMRTNVTNVEHMDRFISIRVITKLPNSEQSYKGKVKTHKYKNRQNQSTTGKLWKP